MKARGLTIVLILTAGAALWAQTASGIPVFARKYGFTCTMCHSAYPRLNDFGQRFRMNGYRLPGKEDAEKTVLEVQAPVAFRTSGGYLGESYNAAAGERNVSDFRMNGLDLLSGGLLGRNAGYFMVYVPQVAGARGVDGQEGALEMASVVLSGLAGTWLNVRAGRFEPAYVPFSGKRMLSVSPYEIYDLSFAGGPPLGDTQSGIELSGYDRHRFSYAAGVVGGSENDRPDDTPSNLYLRASQVLGPGEGQTAGQRVGLTGYLGRSRAPGGTGERSRFYRWSVDASLNYSVANLSALYLWARDDGSLWAAGSGGDVDYSGGFAELSVMPTTRLVGFARLDLVTAPDPDGGDVTRWTGGGRYYLEPNLAVHLEYSHRTEEARQGDDPAFSFITTRLDLAF